MAEKSGPGRPDWRNRNAAGQFPTAGNKNWRDDKRAAAGTSWRSYRGTVLTVLTILLVLAAAAFIKVVVFPEPAKAVCLALLGAGYEENLALPHNAYGMIGLKDLGAASADTQRVKLRHFQKSLISRQVWDEEWSKIQKDCKEDTLVLFLALHGMADETDAYLLFDDPAGSTKLPLTDLLESLAKLDKKVLLILEPALAGAYWPAGMVHNDFVAKLKDPKTGLDKRKNLIVLCASDEGQTSWASEEHGRTIFTEFLIEGLMGEAGGDRAHRIAVADLYEYVKEKVENWAWHNRAAVQTPILLGAADQARTMDLVTLQGAKPANTPNSNLAPAEPLKSLWKDTAELRKAVPAPSVYTPQLWRYYLDLGVRYEQLERAGYPAADLKRLRGVLDGIAARVRNEARCNEAAACMGWTLPMHAVLGIRAPLDDKNIEAGLEALQLADNGKKRNDAFAALASKVPKDFAGGPAEARKLLRGQVQRALLNKIETEIDPKNLEAALQEVRTLADFLDNGEDRPAETHLLVMLLQDLDRKNPPSAELLRTALAVRRQAEEAALAGAAKVRTHPYSEVVFARVRTDIDKADGLRRTGEDWLFASRAADHDRARADLTEAAALFKQAASRASTIRAALDLRDRALADLPYFAWWVAMQRDPKQGQHDRQKELAVWENQTKALAESLRDIAADLDDPKKIDQLVDATAKAKIAYNGLGAALQQELRLLEAPLDEQEHWHQTEAALALPILVVAEGFDAAKNRALLWQNSRRMAQLWNAQQIRPRDAAAGGGVSNKKGRQESMVTAALRPYDVLPDGRGPLAVGDVRAAMEPSADEDKLLKGALSNPDPSAARKPLTRLDFVWRRLPMTQRMEDRADVASRVLRGLRMIDLLVWQADRTARDHWFAEEKTTDYPGFLGVTYYQPAARAYLDAASQLAKQRIDDRKQKEALAKIFADKLTALDKSTWLHRKQGPNLLWTGVQDHLLQWKIAKQDGAFLEPFGVPVAWLSQPKGAKIIDAQTSLAAFPPYQRLTLDAFGPPKDKKEETLDFKLARDKEFVPSTKVNGEFVVLYRGAKLWDTAAVESRAPDLIVRNEQPLKDPEIAVQATAANAAVCIVLDCSPSMKSLSKSGGETKTRYKWATAALEKALSKIPNGTWLSVRAMIDPKNEEIRSPRQWEAGQLVRLIDELAELEKKIPREGSSPIAAALVEAKDKGFRREWPGLRVIVALTDGDDNNSGPVLNQQMPAWDPRNPGPFHKANTAFVKKLMRDEFNGNMKDDYEVHIVCFIDPDNKDDQDEAKRAFDQFNIVTEFEPLPGTFRRQPDGRKLADGLAEAIRPKLYLKRGAATKYISASYEDEGFQWKEVKPATYTPGLRERLQPLTIVKGDKLLVKIIDGGLRRAMVTDKLATRKANRGSVVGVSLHQWDKSGQLNQLIAIEDDDTKLLQHERPGFVWIDTAPAQGEEPPRLIRWQPEYHRTAPSYRLEALKWPSVPGNAIVPAPALTRVWWSDAPAGSMQALVRLTPGEKKADELKKVGIGDSEVSIDEVEITQLRARADEKPTRCLVVNVSYKADKRFRLELMPPPPVEEHRYFTKAGHYTAIFWTDNESVPYTVRIIAVSAICDKLAPVRFDLDRKIDQRLYGDRDN